MSDFATYAAGLARATNATLSSSLLRESTNPGWGTARANYLGALRAEVARRIAEGRTEELNVELASRMFSFEEGITIFRRVDAEPTPSSAETTPPETT
jgi:hypothetical protein